MGWPLARTWGWVRGSCVVPAAVKAGEPGERTQQRGQRGQISPGSDPGHYCMAVGAIWIGGALGGEGAGH